MERKSKLTKNSLKTSFLRNKTTNAIALFLMLTVTVTLVALPLASAHTPKWTIQPYLNIHVAPNPVGVGQQLYIVMFTTWALPGADYYNDVRFRDFKLKITMPDGTTDVRNYPVVTDPGGSIFFLYTPTQVGTYTLLLESPEQTYIWNQANTPAAGVYAGLPASAAIYQNDTILAATKTVTFTVQEGSIGKLDDIPLPTEYWTRPIEAQNFQWGSISSNWLAGAAVDDRWQKDGSAPRTPHVMWTRTLELGGLVGGTQAKDATYYEGFSYETRFNNPIVISGILIYEPPLSNAGGGGGTIAVDLRTGEQVWYLPNVAISKGQIFSFQQTPNQHGAVAPLLWEVSGSTWRAYDALTGKAVFNLTNVPGGTEVYSTGFPFDQNNGMIMRYVFSYNTAARSGWLALWNNTLPVLTTEQVFSSPGWRPVGKGNIPANAPITPAPSGSNTYWNGSAWVSNAVRTAQGYPAVTGPAYNWNVTISADLVGDQAPNIVGIIPDDVILGRSSDVALASNWHPMSDPWTIWALNLNASKGLVGQLLWKKSYPAPSGNQTIMFGHLPIDPVNRVFLMTDRETGQRRGYSIDTGDLLWGPIGEEREIQYYSARQGFPANGTLYVSGYGGEVFAYSTKDGTLLWKYNNTDSGLNTPWGLYPIHVSAVADGIIYGFPGDYIEANKPLFKGERIRAINATTGEEVWNLMSWSTSGLGLSIAPIAIADGFMAYRNIYDSQIYTLGKGPSATIVTASPEVLVQGNSVLIKGTVLDTASGTKQKEQAARFPNGIAAVSDASMSGWMEYVYMQKPRSMNATGVEVTLSVLDSNNNYREIGKTRSNTDGFFTLKWTPDIPGTYTLYASFAGSEGYWPSHSTTSFAVDPAPPPPELAQAQPDMTATYVLRGVVAIIIVIIIIGAAIVLLLRRP